MSMEMPVALVKHPAVSGANTDAKPISTHIETAIAVLFAVTAVVAVSFLAAVTGLF